jgi:short-subunit dehydrogenase
MIPRDPDIALCRSKAGISASVPMVSTDRKDSFIEHYGPWALVTGSSAGIGMEFTRQLASRGLNLALLARRRPKLEALAEELRAGFGVETRVIECDLSSVDYLSRVHEACADLEIGMLVNNAGAPSFHGRFLSRSVEDLENTLHFGVHVQLQLIRHFAESMAARRRGGIIQVSSVSGHLSMPFMAEYSASKAYQLALGEALHYEMKDYGIDVLVLSPGATKSERIDFGMDADAVVARALSQLGKRPSSVPGWRNSWSAFRWRHLYSRQRAIELLGRFQRGRLQPPHDEEVD